MIFFTSDLHFYHENVIRFTQRPFHSVEEMNEALIQNWNRCVSPQDEVYILGDFTMKGPTLAQTVLSQLVGRKHMIRGNHDRFLDTATFDSSVFETVEHYKEIEFQNQIFVLSHYPFLAWNGSFRGSICLHGHQHNTMDYNYKNLEEGCRRYDVGVDANNMTPVSAEDIILFFQMQE